MRRVIHRLRMLPFVFSGIYLLLLLLAVYLHGTAWDIAGQWFSVSPAVGILVSWVCRDLFCGWWHLQCYMPIVPTLMVDFTMGDDSMVTIVMCNAVLMFLLVMTIVNAMIVFGRKHK